MRFDPDRVISLAEEFSEPRLLGTDGEFRAGRKLAELLSEAGWRVEIGAPWKGWDRSRIAVIATFGLFFLFVFGPYYFVPALKRHLPGMPTAFHWLALVIVGALLLAVNVMRATYRAAPFPSGPVVAMDTGAHASRKRLLVMTRLTTRKAEWPDILIRLFVFLVFLSLPMQLVLPIANGRSLEPGSRLAFFIIATQLFALLVLAWGYGPTPAPATRDNRTGLAFLVELARCWPTNAHDRVETWLVAMPRSESLHRELQRRLTDGVPTIALALDSIGVGPDLGLRGLGEAAEIARNAADSLWIPYSRGLRIFNGYAVPLVSIYGSNEDMNINSETLMRTEQLVVEIALRWGRSNERIDPT